MALAELGAPRNGAKTVLRAMEESAASPEMVNYADLLKLDVVRPVRLRSTSWIALWPGFRQLFPDNKNRPKVQRRANWYFGFVRDLAEIAHELGIEVTIGGGNRE